MATIVVDLKIVNTYEGGDEVTTYRKDLEIPAPPERGDSDDYTVQVGGADTASANPPTYEDWAYDNIFSQTGTGRTDGDSWYDVTVTASSDPDLLPVGTTFEFGY